MKESPRDWYECFDEYMIKLGFRESNVELCLYIHGKGKNIIYLLIYLDDLLICSKDKNKIQKVKNLLSDRFEMKDLGEISEYLGIEVDHNYCRNEMKLKRTKYIESLANKYKVHNGK